MRALGRAWGMGRGAWGVVRGAWCTVHGMRHHMVRSMRCFHGACTFGAGDILAQQIEHDMQRQVVAVPPGGAANSYYPAVRGFELDHRRVSVATLMGSVWAGVVLPFVYGFAEKRFPGQSPLNVVLKMGVSCSILSTAGNYVSMLARIVLSDCTTQDLSLRCR